MMTPDYNLADIMPQTKLQLVADTASTVVAGGALTTHLWLPIVREGSEWVAALLPYAGGVLVILQVIYWSMRLRDLRRKRRP